MPYTSVEVCAGAGGQAVGLEAAGFSHLACVEIDLAACETLRANRNWNVISGDLRDWSPGPELVGVTLLAGGVPCPPFSIAGQQLGKEDERDLFPEMVRLARELKPEAIMIENVRGILGSKFTQYRMEIIAEFAQLGFESCGWEVLNASHYGVPQSRLRAILVLMRPEAAQHFEWPTPVAKPVTVAQALRPFLRHWQGYSEWAKGARNVAPALVGGSKKHGGADLGPTRAKAAWRSLGVDAMGVANEPPEPKHDGPLKLTVEMAAAVQGFPRNWKFMGKKTAAYRQVGNAFPPPVAEAVGNQIRLALEAAGVSETSTA